MCCKPVELFIILVSTFLSAITSLTIATLHSLLLFFETVRLKNYANLLSIMTTLLLLTSRRRYCCRHLVVIVGVSALVPLLRSRHRWYLVFVAVLLLLSVVYLLVDASIIFCD